MYQTNAADAADRTAADAPASLASASLAPATAETADLGDSRLVIESRFGTIAVAPNSSIEFPRGLLGFAELHRYALADLADPRLPQFMVLQCLDDHELAFLAMPLEPDSGIIARPDLDAACAALSIAAADVAILLVVTVHRSDDGFVVSANLRAPLLIDSASRIGFQHVLPNNNYPVRFPITEGST